MIYNFSLILCSDESDGETPVAQKPVLGPAIERFVESSVTLSSQPVAHNSDEDIIMSDEQEHNVVVPNHPESVMSRLSSLCRDEIFTDALISNGTRDVKVNGFNSISEVSSE